MKWPCMLIIVLFVMIFENVKKNLQYTRLYSSAFLQFQWRYLVLLWFCFVYFSWGSWWILSLQGTGHTICSRWTVTFQFIWRESTWSAFQCEMWPTLHCGTFWPCSLCHGAACCCSSTVSVLFLYSASLKNPLVCLISFQTVKCRYIYFLQE